MTRVAVAPDVNSLLFLQMAAAAPSIAVTGGGKVCARQQFLFVDAEAVMQVRIIPLMLALFSLFASAKLSGYPQVKAPLEIGAAGNPEKIVQRADQRIATQRTKVAEGEYAIPRIGDLGIQPPGTEEFEFSEVWALWQTGDGELEVEGEWRFDSPETLPNRIPFTLRLSRDLRPLSLKEVVQLKWEADSGPLTCKLSPAELYCESGAQDPKHMIVERLAMTRPYAFLWPISPFSLASLAAIAIQLPDSEVEITAVVAEEPSPANPVCFVSHLARVRYIGQETIEVGGQTVLANKTSLDPSTYPELILWTDPQGLLLAVQRAETLVHAWSW